LELNFTNYVNPILDTVLDSKFTQKIKLKEDIPVSQSVVMKLAKPILGKGYILFLDNWYSSSKLFQILNENNTNVVGTVRKNRKNMPKKLASYKLNKKGRSKNIIFIYIFVEVFCAYAGVIKKMYI